MIVVITVLTSMSSQSRFDDTKQPASTVVRTGAVSGVPGAAIMVAIPAYNEELTIGSVVARTLQYADRVVVVDDGSTDRTAEIADLVGAEVVRHPTNEGYGSAIRTCFELARRYDADVLVTLDGDGQHDPAYIPQLVDELQHTSADIIIGSRFTKGTPNETIPRYRRFGMKVLDRATMVGSGLKLTDSQSGFRAYSRKALRAIDLNQNGMGVSSEIIIRAADSNLKIEEAGIVTRYDGIHVSSTGPIRHGLDVINSIIRLVSQKHPILFFGAPGLFFFTASVLFFLRALDVFNSTKNVITLYAMGWLFCMAVGLFCVLAGLMLWSVQDLSARFKQ